MTFWETATQYLSSGFTHVIPLGFDHILFILSVFLMGTGTRHIIIMCSLFTVAHSISLGLATLNIVSVPADIIEPLIAVSILTTAIQNITGTVNRRWQYLTIFIFGLIHGLGFAGALRETEIPGKHFFISLLFFNAGVELGQITVIGIAHYSFAKWCKNSWWYKERVVYPLSTVTACIAMYWLIVRLLCNDG